MDLDTLTGRLQEAGVLDTGEHISPREVRRLACTARIIPVVLGGDSQVLDVGRATAVLHQAQLIARGLRDGGCTRRWLRLATLDVSRTPLATLDRQRTNRPRQRRAPLPPTPRPSPRD